MKREKGPNLALCGVRFFYGIPYTPEIRVLSGFRIAPYLRNPYNTLLENNMKLLKYVSFLFFFIPMSVSAEYCWMAGCQNLLGYVRMEINPAGQYMPFCDSAPPSVGSEAVLCAPAYLRVYALAAPLGKEDEKAIAEQGRMGSGSKVKVLDIIQLDGTKFVAVRVISDEYKCPYGNDRCSGTWY